MKLATRIFRKNRGTGADQYYITSPYGWRVDPISGERKFHAGCDYGTHGNKWPQYALEDGIVESVWTDSAGAKCLRIRYDRLGYRCTHCHLDSILVHTGQNVTADTIVGYTGKTGYATGVHLDLRVQYVGSSTYQDPESFEYIEPGPTPPGPTPPTPEPTPVTPWAGIVKRNSPLYDVYGNKYPNGASADRPVQVRGFINGRYQVYGQTFNPHIVYVDKSSLK